LFNVFSKYYTPSEHAISANELAAPLRLIAATSAEFNVFHTNLKYFSVFSAPILVLIYPIAFAANERTSISGSPNATSKPPTIISIYGTRSSAYLINIGRQPTSLDANYFYCESNDLNP